VHPRVCARPDLNASTTDVRIALETIARRGAIRLALRRGSPAAPDDKWGAALVYLRSEGLITREAEQGIAAAYTFISPGEIGAVFGVTGSRIAQIRTRALERLRWRLAQT
jgi:hypothetical protein